MTTAQETHLDPRMPPRDRCVLRPLLDRHLCERPDRIFALFEDGRAWSYAELHRRVVRAAVGLQQLGVRQGQHVLSWLPNGPEALTLWFALNYIGAVYVPINIGYRGRLLEHVIDNADAALLVAHADLIDRLDKVALGSLRQLVCIGGAPAKVAGLSAASARDLFEADGELQPLEREIQPWDTQSIIYTSGTTGPSKGVLSSYLHLYSTGMAFHFITEDDRSLVNLPLFHAGGTGAVYRMLVRGASVAIVETFKTQTFWQKIVETRATFLTLLGAMAPFLMKEPPGPRDRDHTLRAVMMVPLHEEAAAFSRRFGVDIYTTFNMTEISCPIFSERNPTKAGACGRARAGVELRVVDESDCEVALGATGELVVRTDMPWALNHGYYKNPDATAKAWRNGWFHTGDAFRVDAEGNYFFVDRIKDAIRRRGENISSFEVESEICAHPDVQEAAVVAVASEFGEDDVLAVVAPIPGRQIDPGALIEFLRPRLAHFMVPRYLRSVVELPKTPTQKVQKHLLRGEGLTADTWDREKAGIKLKRERLLPR